MRIRGRNSLCQPSVLIMRGKFVLVIFQCEYCKIRGINRNFMTTSSFWTCELQRQHQEALAWRGFGFSLGNVNYVADTLFATVIQWKDFFRDKNVSPCKWYLVCVVFDDNSKS